MAGSLVDLSVPPTSLPPQLIVDPNIVIDWLLAYANLSSARPMQVGAPSRSALLVKRLRSEQTIGLVTSTGANEVFHYVMKVGYRTALPDFRADLLSRYPNVRRHGWEQLFKARSDLMKRIAGDLDRVRQLMTSENLRFLQPDELGALPSGLTLDDALVRAMERYELDSNDAAILVEARRAGVTAIAATDPDLRRARLDFDVYTWP